MSCSPRRQRGLLAIGRDEQVADALRQFVREEHRPPRFVDEPHTDALPADDSVDNRRGFSRPWWCATSDL